MVRIHLFPLSRKFEFRFVAEIPTNSMNRDSDSLADEAIHFKDDIRREYHPNSGREPEICRFEDYRSSAPSSTSPIEPEPWLPFKTREDFEFAEIALATAMSKEQVNATIGLLHRCIGKGKGSFTLSNFNEMRETLKVASNRLPRVSSGSR